MINLFWSGLLMVLLVSGCGGSGTPTRHNDFVPLTSITIVAEAPAIEASRTIAANTSTRLTVIGNYSGQFSRDITDQTVWSSASPAVADFNTTFPSRVKGLTAGTAVLTATVGSLSASYTLTVSSTTINTLTISPASPSVASGLTTQLAVKGTFLDNTTQDLTFDADWSADASGFASVSNDPVNKGLVKGLAAGTATITATFGAVTGTTQLAVIAPLLQSITVKPANSSLSGFSKTVQFTATGTYSDGTTTPITSGVVWDSSQKSIATIDSSGLATSVAAGTTSISATVGSLSGKTDLTVTAPVLATNGLQITPPTPVLSLSTGTTLQLTLTATFADNSTQIVTSNASWSISTVSSIATIGTTTGLVTANSLGFGTVAITATYLGQSASTVVTITQ